MDQQLLIDLRLKQLLIDELNNITPGVGPFSATETLFEQT